MDRKKIETAITALLVAVFILATVRLFILKNKHAAVISPPAKKMGGYIKSKDDAGVARSTVIKNKIDNVKWDINPFILGHASGEGVSKVINLTGIMWDIKDPQAIIGDTLVRQGDIIGKYRVVKINKDSVVLKSDEGEVVLRIWEE